ncbi:MAG: methylmalonyl Co-A mutase-associated GTPase MeaB [Flavobacteriaceae bacterium]|nr:MAG: methylmalonyl Co-A mutase-associated GTPase MeaB [Flavobacteriaceae bacterium]
MIDKKNTSKTSISKVRSFRKKTLAIDSYIEGILKNDKATLGKAITLIESSINEHIEKAKTVIEKCLSKENNSIRIGITGVPGVGKSTFIEALGKNLTATGKKVAVLAVDPTSSVSKGSILGDKTRMQELAKDPNAFIRPSPSGETLGGVGRKTRETIILCEAAGYDIILIETVGVGQSETLVHSMVDFFLVLKLAGAGGELQGIKRGIIEMADALVINKADEDNIKQSKLAQIEFQRALHLYPPKINGWTPKVLLTSAIHKMGINEVWKMIKQYLTQTKQNGFFAENRKKQNEYWVLQTIDNQLKQEFYQNKSVKKMIANVLQEVHENKISPFNAAEKLLLLSKKELK